MPGQKAAGICCAVAVSALISLFTLAGCADRDELEELKRQQAPSYNAEANEALEKAETAMIEADIDINFSELSGLESMTDLSTVLPDPLQISQLEKQQKMEEAIGELYVALDALGETEAALAPSKIQARPSNSDLFWIHLHLSYCYALAAVSRLQRVGLGPDGIRGTKDDLFYIAFSKDPMKAEVYKFTFTERGQALMDSVNPDVDPLGYIKIFYREGQVEALQSIVDALLILLGAELAVAENPAEGIIAQKPGVNRQVYRQSALYHLNRAAILGGLIAPEMGQALRNLELVIVTNFSKDMLENAIKWGFEVRSIPRVFLEILEKRRGI